MPPKRISPRKKSEPSKPSNTVPDEIRPAEDTLQVIPIGKSSTKNLGQLCVEDYLILINWLKCEENYDSCFGSENETRVGFPPSSKVNGSK